MRITVLVRFCRVGVTVPRMWLRWAGIPGSRWVFRLVGAGSGLVCQVLSRLVRVVRAPMRSPAQGWWLA